MGKRDFKDIKELLKIAGLNNDIIIDYLLEYTDGGYKSLDEKAKNEIDAFNHWVFYFKHIFVMTILFKCLQDGTSLPKFTMDGGCKILTNFINLYEQQANKEFDLLMSILHYSRQSNHKFDIIEKFCEKEMEEGAGMGNRWNYPLNYKVGKEQLEQEVSYLRADNKRKENEINNLRNENKQLKELISKSRELPFKINVIKELIERRNEINNEELQEVIITCCFPTDSESNHVEKLIMVLWIKKIMEKIIIPMMNCRERECEELARWYYNKYGKGKSIVALDYDIEELAREIHNIMNNPDNEHK